MTTTKSTVANPPCEERLKKALETADFEQTICQVFFCYLSTKHFQKECKDSRRRILRHIYRCVAHL